MNFTKVACPIPPCFLSEVNGVSTPWLTTRKRLCPICKRDIIVEEPNNVGEESRLLNHRDEDWRGDTASGSV